MFRFGVEKIENGHSSHEGNTEEGCEYRDKEMPLVPPSPVPTTPCGVLTENATCVVDSTTRHSRDDETQCHAMNSGSVGIERGRINGGRSSPRTTRSHASFDSDPLNMTTKLSVSHEFYWLAVNTE